MDARRAPPRVTARGAVDDGVHETSVRVLAEPGKHLSYDRAKAVGIERRQRLPKQRVVFHGSPSSGPRTVVTKWLSAAYFRIRRRISSALPARVAAFMVKVYALCTSRAVTSYP